MKQKRQNLAKPPPPSVSASTSVPIKSDAATPDNTQPTSDSASSPAPPASQSSFADAVGPTVGALKSLVAELRLARQETPRQFTFLRALATLIQILAMICLLGAFFVGGADAMDTFIRWAVVAIVLQLATLAMLLFDRPS